MKKLISLRPVNLLIIVATMFAMRYCIANAIMNVNGFEVSLPLWQFILLVIAVVLITLGGYVINDYFDIETDSLNGKNNFASQLQDKENALIWYAVFSITGIVIGGFVSWQIGYPKFMLIFFIAASLLWFYSSGLKQQVLVGNLIVAFLTALVPMLVAVYEIPVANTRYASILKTYGIDFMVVVYWITAFAVFAFILTLTREIIKDMEDYEGDKATGANTLPVVIGMKASKAIVIILLIATISAIAYLYYKYLQNNLVLAYLLVLVVIPLIITGIKVLLAKNSNDYKLCSTFVKIIMASGIGFSALACYLFSKI